MNPSQVDAKILAVKSQLETARGELQIQLWLARSGIPGSEHLADLEVERLLETLTQDPDQGSIWSAYDEKAILLRLRSLRRDILELEKSWTILEQEHIRIPWTRYWKTNSKGKNGHIHNKQDCVSCRRKDGNGSKARRADLIWLVDMSGKTPEHVAGLYGAILCRHCFPGLDPGLFDGSGRDYCSGREQGNVVLPYGDTQVSECAECGGYHPLTDGGLLTRHHP